MAGVVSPETFYEDECTGPATSLSANCTARAPTPWISLRNLVDLVADELSRDVDNESLATRGGN